MDNPQPDPEIQVFLDELNALQTKHSMVLLPKLSLSPEGVFPQVVVMKKSQIPTTPEQPVEPPQGTVTPV